MRQVRIGSMRIDLVSEIPSLAFEKTWLFANVTDEVIAENRSWLDHRYIEPETGRFILSHHSYLVRTPRWTAIVDTCCGNHKHRPRVPVWDNLNRPYLDNMQALGVAPEEVDFVMCTHLHVDHVGWNTRLLDGRWVPTFPNARYLMGREEYRHFETAHNAAPKRPVNHGSFEDSVLPVVAAGLAELVETDHRVFSDRDAGLRFAPAPGHTAGNMQIHLNGGHDHAVMSGDVIHHPIQCAAPWLSNAADVDPAAAVATRMALLEELADTPGYLLTGHFPAPTAGRVVRHGDAYRFRFED
ncbi:glyoxylase-like metal-dependent hydrolase (beta-lactamase superfamily II) [Bradyrhizobium japonicum]|jgi:glyoxylase-like metal-dependent hydrolase (beta-lactamase superfamily II)|uniref:MBL fold metallo-hydrolase n=1 Tax=Bradyrhizobium TaxID=374 RepID=UPI000421B8BC|nr:MULTISPECIES: MBL fold metallo-hydrolase [Bradyrhizobium]MBR0883937.1 MBL fold metallo-hydrolase [Bradyrhizobium liaoningense]MBR0942415.1 MBL fold metallo-hydrolase [Bradyrhizobium liaoningense]MBR1004112.1 MBL fold metallo-hydrolase [Bradyrhizobium liaoningense]MBR1026468.1 MBL fold metallo-hydrolase [Bradyrhizobium liaoningense]MBR1070408.1 MBL fold metallo-hydrolase [Bradyrhizobium liaoningense]